MLRRRRSAASAAAASASAAAASASSASLAAAASASVAATSASAACFSSLAFSRDCNSLTRRLDADGPSTKYKLPAFVASTPPTRLSTVWHAAVSAIRRASTRAEPRPPPPP